jgi:hypothetical protein
MTIEEPKLFPTVDKFKKELKEENIQIQVYGRRLYRDQSFFEYLLEFLLIFVSPKGTEKMFLEESEKNNAFTFNLPNKEELCYYPSPRLGLKRFIFLNRSELDKRFKVDVKALNAHRDYLKDKIDVEYSSTKDKEYMLDILQDLLYGFNAIIGKRSWFAQSLLPVAPELILCEARGEKKIREKMGYYSSNNDVDSKFSFTSRMFMARGGEVYFLHIAQALENQLDKKEILEKKLKELLESIPQLSNIANFLQNNWFEAHNYNFTNEDEVDGIRFIKKNVKWIPETYKERGVLAVDELINLLSANIEPLEKINMLGNLVVLQILRMMCLQSKKFIGELDNQEWLIDLLGNPKASIRKKAIQSYQRLEESLFTVVHHADIETYKEKGKVKEELKILTEASKDTNLLFRKLGKELGLIVPPKGAHMRMALNENIIKLLVLSLIKPGERMLLTSFLEKCYKHFRIIIGPEEAKKHWLNELDGEMGDFDKNMLKFQSMLKDCGFLRNLSDSTSIVENPFKG